MRKALRSLVLLLALLPMAVSAQEEGRSQKEQEKIQAKQDKKKKKDARKAEKELWKQHLDRQDKATAKRLKKNRRRSDRTGQEGYRGSWIERTFR